MRRRWSLIPVSPMHPLSKGVLLALDPGLRYPAAALFRDGVLKWAERVKVPGKYAKKPIGERIRDIALLVVELVKTEDVTHYVWEMPVVYAKKRGAIRLADPNDLLPLAALGAAVASYLRPETVIFAPTPREWSCNTSKSKKSDEVWTSSRGVRALVRFSDEERSRVQENHDSLDAACLALYILGRWEPLKVFSRS